MRPVRFEQGRRRYRRTTVLDSVFFCRSMDIAAGNSLISGKCFFNCCVLKVSRMYLAVSRISGSILDLLYLAFR